MIPVIAKTPVYVSYPLLVVEVLSDSTVAFDRGAKFAAYRKLESLQDYVLVDVATLEALTGNSPENAAPL